MPMQATQLRVGNIIEHEGHLWRVMKVVHVTPGNWRGLLQTKLRNIHSGTQTEHRFPSEDQVERVTFEQHEVEYLTRAPRPVHLHERRDYEQSSSAGHARDAVDYLTPELPHRGRVPRGDGMGVELPKTVDLKVVETAPGLKRATGHQRAEARRPWRPGSWSRAELHRDGEVITVDTETGEYFGRAKG